MPSISIPVASILLLAGTLSAQTAVQSVVQPPGQTTPQTASSPEASRVRIVRLSDIRGVVQLDRATGRGYEPAIANLPIVENSKLQTGAGVAEVEFEDNSTLRIAPGSIVEFPQLDRLPDGATVSSVRLVKGTAYLSLLKTKGNQFNLLFGQQKLQLPPSTHIRLQMDAAQATLAVFEGSVHLDGPAGPIDVTKNKSATFQLQDQSQPTQITLAKNIPPQAFDAWDKNAAAAHAQAAGLSAFGSPYAYGVGDMMYYGAFTTISGCGSIWRPYFTTMDWDPYSNGIWAWYQGAGYSWVSPYPWGWTPYHFGTWDFCPGAGWGWRPGGTWSGLNNVATIVHRAGSAPTTGPGRFPPRPIRPVMPPGKTGPTLIVANQKPLVRSEVSANSFVFRTDSAGLGIPREGLGKLDKFSQGAASHGFATTPIYFNGGGNGRPGNEGIGQGSFQRGSRPEHESQNSQQSGGWRGGNENGNSSRSGSSQSGSQPSRSSSDSGMGRSGPEPGGGQSMRSGPPPSSGPPPPSAGPSGSSPHH